jgi:hypothetical protein
MPVVLRAAGQLNLLMLTLSKKEMKPNSGLTLSGLRAKAGFEKATCVTSSALSKISWSFS